MKNGTTDRLYIIGDEFSLTRLKKKFLKTAVKILPGYKLRRSLLRKCNYHIGNDVFLGEDLIIIDDLRDDETNLIIEDRVAVSPRVTMILHSTPNWSKIADQVNSVKGKIVIKKDSWIGTGAVLFPNIIIGESSVIGANSVVTKNVPPYAVVGGVPAKLIKTLIPPETVER